MNQKTAQIAPMIPDPKLGRILALGIKPIPEPPKLYVQTSDGVLVGFMPSGKVSIFYAGAVAACECSGHPVDKLPKGARLVAGIAVDLQPILIYRTLSDFYTVRGSLVTQCSSDPDENDCDSLHQTPEVSTPDDNDPWFPVYTNDD